MEVSKVMDFIKTNAKDLSPGDEILFTGLQIYQTSQKYRNYTRTVNYFWEWCSLGEVEVKSQKGTKLKRVPKEVKDHIKETILEWYRIELEL